MTLDTAKADAPAGADFDLRLPDDRNAAGLASPHLRDVKVTLPEGVSINPASADGLVACDDSQLKLGTDLGLKAGEPSCPSASQIGTVTAWSPALDEPLTGALYLRPQSSQDPESGEMFRLALIVRSEERGLIVKLPGSARANPVTGQLTATFDNNPQLPVERIKLSLKSGPRAPLATPAACGTKTTDAELVSWAGHDVHKTSTFDIACTPGLGGFAPTLTAGVVNPIGGAFSPFALTIRQARWQQRCQRAADAAAHGPGRQPQGQHRNAGRHA